MAKGKTQDEILIKNVEINNFKGIKNCKVDDLSLVNFFIGDNNSGKSTLLDAIFLGCKEPTAITLPAVLNERIQRDFGISELFFGYNNNSEVEMNLGFNNGYNHTVSFFITKNKIYEENKGAEILGNELASCFKMDDNIWYSTGYRPNFDTRYGFLEPSFLKEEIRSFGKGAMIFYSTIKKDDLTVMLDNLLGQLKLNSELESDLADIIVDIYGRFDYEFIPRPENFADRRLAIKENNSWVFSDFIGDGEQRAISILSSLKLLNDTTVFIEEIEAFQHPSTLQRLSKHLVDIAKKNRIQLFITTHSYFNALRDFYYAFENDKERKMLFRNYVISRDNGIIDVKKKNDVHKIINEYKT